jgi:hypothetical protein
MYISIQTLQKRKALSATKDQQTVRHWRKIRSGATNYGFSMENEGKSGPWDSLPQIQNCRKPVPEKRHLN